jgi:ABC-2 type transport system ATP-binding protein
MAALVLEIDGLTKRYGAIVALRDLSFEIRSGEVVSFVGRNGAGKRKTMRIVLGVFSADAGQVRWASARLTFAVRRRIGCMLEERGLYPKMYVFAAGTALVSR